MIRPSEPADSPQLLDLALRTGVFKPHEIQALDEVLRDYHATNRELGHRSVTAAVGEDILGFAYYAPAAMTDRAWYLYWIAVRRDTQGKGLGGKLLVHAEDDIRGRAGRLLLIETSSLEHYQPTRQFYLNHSYQQTASITDFYADGDSMVVFSKRLT